jgi:hypothetical protein
MRYLLLGRPQKKAVAKSKLLSRHATLQRPNSPAKLSEAKISIPSPLSKQQNQAASLSGYSARRSRQILQPVGED